MAVTAAHTLMVRTKSCDDVMSHIVKSIDQSEAILLTNQRPVFTYMGSGAGSGSGSGVGGGVGSLGGGGVAGLGGRGCLKHGDYMEIFTQSRHLCRLGFITQYNGECGSSTIHHSPITKLPQFQILKLVQHL